MPVNVDNIKAQMRKGILEYCILSIISRQDAYATVIINELKAAEMIVVEGTLYPILTRLKNQGLLTYRWEESPQGPPRKYYTGQPISCCIGRRMARIRRPDQPDSKRFGQKGVASYAFPEATTNSPRRIQSVSRWD
jgi:PadR family transcriptional regulator PadR